MPSTYPTTLDALPTAAANGDTSLNTHPALHNDANAAINAVQETLGTNPQGAAASVSARIAALEGGGGGTLTRADVALSAVSQSSTYAGTTSATVSNMTDGDPMTGTGTGNDIGAYIQVEWPTQKLICAVRLGFGTLAGFGSTWSYGQPSALHRHIQYWNGAAWVRWISSGGSGGFLSNVVPEATEYAAAPVLTTKLRLVAISGPPDYVALTEFVPIELKVG